MKLYSVPLNDIQHVLIYGAPKSGKTEIVGALAEHYNLYYFDCENGFKTLQKMPMDWQERVELFSVPDTRAWPIAIETIGKLIESRGEIGICEAHGKINCFNCKKENKAVSLLDTSKFTNKDIVIIDTLSQVAISAMNNITRKEDDDYKPTWEDYRKQGFLMDRILTNIQQAPFNVVCISHEIDVSKDDKVIKLSGMAGTTNFSRNTGKFFDHVVYCEVKNKGHYFGSATTYSTLALTGSRLDVTMEKMGKPSLLPIFDGSWKEALAEGRKEDKKAAGGILSSLKK